MQIPTTYTFIRYLAAKKTVDDRALNQHVWASMAHAVAQRQALISPEPLHVLEIGAGIGTMIERLLAAGVLPHAAYTALDSEADNIRTAAQRVPEWARNQGFTVSQRSNRQLHITNHEADIILHLSVTDLFDFLAEESETASYDLLIAHAFLDLVDIPATLPQLRDLLKPGGLGYFTINFDGATILQPEIDAPYDAVIEALYHKTMDARLVNGRPSGDSRSGRHMFGHLASAGFTILDAGSSDWVIFPRSKGYVADEAYFLHFIIHTMRGALIDHPELPERERYSQWIAQRHQQIAQHELTYIAHQLDFLVEAPQRRL